MKILEVRLWGDRVGALGWDAGRGLARFQYDADFLRSGLQLSPLRVSATRKVQQFPELARSRGFLGLPGFIADSLPGQFGTRVLQAWSSAQGRPPGDLNPLELLSLIGTRGMGALEYLPDAQAQQQIAAVSLNVGELCGTAAKVIADEPGMNISALNALMTTGITADGLEAMVGWNPVSGQCLAGHASLPAGFEHYVLKFDGIAVADNTLRGQMGRIEYAYNEMAHACGINVMESHLHQEGRQAWLMTRRADRVDGSGKVHRVSFAGMAHADRDSAGVYGYEQLFQTIRELQLGQEALNEMYRRMLFNICARNLGDNTASHNFLMFGDGVWQLAPATDVRFTPPPRGRALQQHQLSCNGKRDNFVVDDLLQAAKAADVKRPLLQLERVQHAIEHWPAFASAAGVSEKLAAEIGQQHQLFMERTPVSAATAEGPAQGSLF